MHIKNATTHVLRQLPVQGRAALAEIKSLVSSQYFPIRTEDVLVALRQSPLGRPSEALVRGVVDMLIFEFFDPSSSLYSSKGTRHALSGCLELHREVAESRYRTQVNKAVVQARDNELLRAAILVFLIKNGWDLLDTPAKTKLRTYLARGPKDEVITILPYVGSIEDLKFTTNVIIGGLDRNQLSSVIYVRALKATVIKRAIELYKAVRNWTDANQVAETLIIPLAGDLTFQHVEEIIASIAQGADLLGSNAFPVVLKKLVTRRALTKEQLEQILTANNLANYMPEVTDEDMVEDDEIPF